MFIQLIHKDYSHERNHQTAFRRTQLQGLKLQGLNIYRTSVSVSRVVSSGPLRLEVADRRTCGDRVLRLMGYEVVASLPSWWAQVEAKPAWLRSVTP